MMQRADGFRSSVNLIVHAHVEYFIEVDLAAMDTEAWILTVMVLNDRERLKDAQVALRV